MVVLPGVLMVVLTVVLMVLVLRFQAVHQQLLSDGSGESRPNAVMSALIRDIIATLLPSWL